MKITRRVLALLLILAAPLILFPSAQTTEKAAAKNQYLAFVGTYTTKTNSKGIYAYNFDSETGKLAVRGLAAETPDPSWIAIHPFGRFAYAANESGKQSTISAFSIDAKSARLMLLNQLPALGEDPCHLSFDKTGKFLFAANYTSGNVAVFPILPDGKLGEHTALVKDAGTLGPNKERQEAPHAHWVQISPDNRFLLVADLGLDQILVYRFDPSNGTISPNDPPFAKLAPGAGPRHAVFSRNGKFLYVLNEINSTVTSFTYDSAKGALRELRVLPTLPVGSQGRNEPAEIVLLPLGKFGESLFASNRGFDTITLFFADPEKGGPEGPASFFPAGGKEPRHIAIDPGGHFLLTENQNSNTITVFHLDPPVFTFPLAKVSQADGIVSPVCLAFLAVE
jgi:6-phosphogluconolactonase